MTGHDNDTETPTSRQDGGANALRTARFRFRCSITLLGLALLLAGLGWGGFGEWGRTVKRPPTGRSSGFLARAPTN